MPVYVCVCVCVCVCQCICVAMDKHINTSLPHSQSCSDSKTVVFLDFYADWCRFSQQLRPIFDKAADELKEQGQASPPLPSHTMLALHLMLLLHNHRKMWCLGWWIVKPTVSPSEREGRRDRGREGGRQGWMEGGRGGRREREGEREEEREGGREGGKERGREEEREGRREGGKGGREGWREKERGRKFTPWCNCLQWAGCTLLLTSLS